MAQPSSSIKSIKFFANEVLANFSLEDFKLWMYTYLDASKKITHDRYFVVKLDNIPKLITTNNLSTLYRFILEFIDNDKRRIAELIYFHIAGRVDRILGTDYKSFEYTKKNEYQEDDEKYRAIISINEAFNDVMKYYYREVEKVEPEPDNNLQKTDTESDTNSTEEWEDDTIPEIITFSQSEIETIKKMNTKVKALECITGSKSALEFIMSNFKIKPTSKVSVLVKLSPEIQKHGKEMQVFMNRVKNHLLDN